MATLYYKILPTRRKANGCLGIYLAVGHHADVRYISTEFEIDGEHQFDAKKWVVYHKEANIINKRMRFVLEEYQEKLSNLSIERYKTAAALKNALLGIDEGDESDELTIKKLFENRIKRLTEENRSSYAGMNKYTLNVLISILGDMPLQYISRNTIKLLHNTMLRRGYKAGNIQMRMTHFKAAINEAIEDGLVRYEEHPFGKYTMPRSEPKLMDITVEQFNAIRTLQTTSKQIQFGRDLFLLSFYLGGINLADLVKADLSGTTLNYVRQKSSEHKLGDRHTILTIQPEARAIIDRYITPAGIIKIPYESGNYKNIQRWCNRCLAMLANRVGITTDFSYYSARKTFTQFGFMIGIKTEIIEYCIGQTMKSNRPIYNYVRVMQHQADHAIAHIIDYTRNPARYEAFLPQLYTDFTTNAM